MKLGQIVEPQVLWDVRSFVALHHDIVAAYGHDEDVAEASSEPEITNVARMNDVETAVALNHRSALLS
jgi:hypothetical protein